VGRDRKLLRGEERGNVLGRTRTSSNCFLPTEILVVTSGQLSILFLPPHHWVCIRLVHDSSSGNPIGCLEKGRGFRARKRCRSTSAWGPLLYCSTSASLYFAALPTPPVRPPGGFISLGGERVSLSPPGFTSKQQSQASCCRRSVSPSPTGPVLPHRLRNRQWPAGSCRGPKSLV